MLPFQKKNIFFVVDCTLFKNCNCVFMFSFKGFLQVWARESAVDVHVHGIDVMSRLEGRIYEVRLPDGSILTVDPLLTQVKIISKQSQVGKTQGLCHSGDQCQSAECLFTTWRYVCFRLIFWVRFIRCHVSKMTIQFIVFWVLKFLVEVKKRSH